MYQLFLMLPYQFDACQITAFDDINGKERRDSCAADNFFPLSYAQMKQEPGDYPLEYLEALASNHLIDSLPERTRHEPQ